MFVFVIDFVNLLLAALVVGALFGAWLILNLAGLAFTAYVTLQQQAVRTMNNVMPALGAVTILLTITSAILERHNRGQLCLIVAAAACFVAIGLITRFLNQPLNSIVMTWRVIRHRTGRFCAMSGGAGT